MRCEDMTSVVRSGETKPACIARPASTGSVASTKSTRPGFGVFGTVTVVVLPAVTVTVCGAAGW